VLITNRPVGTWGEILGDTTAAAMLDRLRHRSVVITLAGSSYCLRQGASAAEELRRVTTGTNMSQPTNATWGVSVSTPEEDR